MPYIDEGGGEHCEKHLFEVALQNILNVVQEEASVCIDIYLFMCVK